MKILFAAGGSGGHIIPALAVADYVRQNFPEVQIVFVSSKNTLDAEIFAGHPVPYPRHEISTGKWRRYFSWQNFLDIGKFFKGIFEARTLLKELHPDVVFSKGGFVALPVGIAAKLRSVPLVIHESDAIPGFANRLLRKMAAQILTAFPFDFGIFVGTPVRQEIRKGDAGRGRKFLGFPEGVKILLVTGGSQGAESLNRLLLHALPGILERKVAVVHLCGRGKSAEQDSSYYRSFEYLGTEFADVLAAADLIISRSGSSALFEIAAAGKPVLLIPLASAANNHQYGNALFFEQAGAARIFSETKATSAAFQNTVLEFLADDAGRAKMSENIHKLARPDAVEKIARILLAFGA